jgi:signal transduction histidine kinase/GGDEF domain-containing protein
MEIRMGAEPIRVLLIEDNPGDARLVRELLSEGQSSSFHLEHVSNLESGLARLAEGGIDVVLSDLGLPDSQGLDTLAEVRAQAPGVPFVALTGVNDDALGTRLVQAGAEDYLVKGQPDRVLLVRTIRHAIERHRLLVEVAAASRAKSEFLGNVSHEMRTPLTSIRSALSNILAGVAGDLPEVLREYLAMLDQDCARMCALVNNLLDEARFSAGRVALERDVMDVGEPAQRVAAACRSRAQEKSITVRLAIPATVPPVYGDEGRIEQVLTNLVGNAIKFTPEGGCMTIGAEQRGESVVVSVVDTGPGIAPEDWEKVFERFAQVGRQPGAGAKGTGLGLTICRDIVSLHGGKIWVEGAPGEGSRFLFTLPIAGPETALASGLAVAIGHAKSQGAALSVVLVKVQEGGEGDRVQPEVARGILDETKRAMKTSLRANGDVVFCCGHDEMGFVLAGADRAHRERIRERLAEQVAERQAAARRPGTFLVLSGAASYPADGETAADLLAQARERLRQSSRVAASQATPGGPENVQ